MFSFEIRSDWTTPCVLGWYYASFHQCGGTGCLHPVLVSVGMRTYSVWQVLLLCWLNILNILPLKLINSTNIYWVPARRWALCKAWGSVGERNRHGLLFSFMLQSRAALINTVATSHVWLYGAPEKWLVQTEMLWSIKYTLGFKEYPPKVSH